MADPYATEVPDQSGKPTGDAPWLAALVEAGGRLIDADAVVPEAEFLVVHCRGVGVLPPLARVESPMAVLLWLEHVDRSAEARTANALLRELDQVSSPVYALKHGWVAGPEGRDGAIAIDAGLIGRLLAVREQIVWERDPDFGYEVPAATPGIADPEARVLMPRLLYADHDRVYEHAGLVAAKQRERAEIVAANPGLDPRIEAQTRWPPVPTGSDWKEARA